MGFMDEVCRGTRWRWLSTAGAASQPASRIANFFNCILSRVYIKRNENIMKEHFTKQKLFGIIEILRV